MISNNEIINKIFVIIISMIILAYQVMMLNQSHSKLNPIQMMIYNPKTKKGKDFFSS